MDAHLFSLFCKAALPLLDGARIEKIQEPAPDLLVLSLFAQGKKRQLLFRFGRKEPFCFMSGQKMAASKTPSAPIMRMRRYFMDRRIAAIVVQSCSRRLWLMASGAQQENSGQNGKSIWLCLDLKAGASLHFYDYPDHPVQEDFEWPKLSDVASALDNWRHWPALTPPLRKTMAKLDEPEQKALLTDLQAGGGDVFLYRENAPAGKIIQISAWPLPEDICHGCKEEPRDDILAAIGEAGHNLVLDRIAQDREKSLLAPMRKRIRQIGKLLDKLAFDEKKFLQALGNEKDALALKNNLWQWAADAREDFVTIAGGDEERIINLDRRFSVRQNMERLFHAIKRAKRGLQKIAQRKIELENELNALNKSNMQGEIAANLTQADKGDTTRNNEKEKGHSHASAIALARILPKNVQVYAGCDGFIYLRGKDAKGNRAMRKFASPHDIWAHVATGAGAHVIIRRPHPACEIPESTLLEAGALAAAKSWLCAAASAEIIFAELRHVKAVKGGPAGKVIYDKVYRSIMVPVDEKIEERLLSPRE